MTDPQTTQDRTSARRDADDTPTKKASQKKTTKPSGLKLGGGPGPINNKTIRDKVQNWQTSGGGVVLAPDATGAVPDHEAIEPTKPLVVTSKSQPSTPRGTRDRGNTLAGDKDTPRPKTASKPTKNTLDEEVRIASAPKKRVVSDSNWRKNKSPPKDGKSDGRPIGWVRTPVRPRVKAVDPEPEGNEEKDEAEEEDARANTVRRRQRSEIVKLGIDAFRKPTQPEQAAVDVYSDSELVSLESSPRKRSPTTRKHRTRHSPRTSLSAEESLPRSPSKPQLDKTPTDSQSPREGSEEETPTTRRRRRRRSPPLTDRRVDIPPIVDASAHEEAADELRTARRRLRKRQPQEIDHADVDEAMTAASTPKVFPTRVEAWLTSTPDPFVESKAKSEASSRTSGSVVTTSDTSVLTMTETDLTSSVPISEPVKRRLPKSSEPPPAPGDEVGTESSHVSHTRKGSDVEPPAPLEIKKVHQSPSLSAKQLKRSGAVRSSQSPSKGRIKSPLTPDDVPDERSVVSSAASSSVEGSMFDHSSHHSTRSKPQNVPLRRAFPTTGKRLSTIASVETFNTHAQRSAPSHAEGSDVTSTDLSSARRDAHDDVSTVSVRSRRSVRAKAVSHADLMSVLSLPRSKSKSLVSARSIRTNRTRLEDLTIDSLFKELVTDEDKYKRELNTLVDGVIPVLLACVLSRSDAAIAAGLFSKSASQNDPNFTKPIVDMGIALERLKSLHRRIPLQDTDALVAWASSAERIYADYIKSWRLGFQDVVVNLAPVNESEQEATSNSKTSVWDEGLPRNEEGYVVNEQGERVDVAFLLKRPLVRLKYLAKTFKGIQHLRSSEKADKVATTCQKLVEDARARNNEERARLEDEAAAAIDPTRARDPKSLKALQGVSIDPSRCVRARDYFDMHLQHSSGQEIDCRVELLIRDDPPGKGSGSDILLCDVDTANRWLFFPPIQLSRISARPGDVPGELVVMIRGIQTGGDEWREVFSLKSTDEEAGPEWLQMLGDSPVPPPLAQISSAASFTSKSSHMASSYGSSLVSAAQTTSTGYTTPTKSRTPSPRQLDIPVGEPAVSTSKRWSKAVSPSDNTSNERALVLSGQPKHDGLHDRNQRTPRDKPQSESRHIEPNSEIAKKRTPPARYSRSTPSTPQSFAHDRRSKDVTSTRSKAEQSMTPPTSPPLSTTGSQSSYSVWLPSSDNGKGSCGSDESDGDKDVTPKRPTRPQPHRRASSVPSADLPTIPRIRKETSNDDNKSQTSRRHERTDSAPLPLSSVRNAQSKLKSRDDEDDSMLGRQDTVVRKTKGGAQGDSVPPPPPPHKTPPQARPASASSKPSTSKITVPVLSPFRNHRRTSSPLKHEYEPSTASDEDSASSLSESESSATSDDASFTSDDDDSLEDDFVVPPLALPPITPQHEMPTTPPSTSAGSLPEDTLGPSNSASQAPYREVPVKSNVVYKGVASIFTWKEERSGLAQWEAIRPEGCHVIVKPGFIEVFELSDALKQPELNEEARPLLALGLTPNVMVHRGTHIDIDIRSPPLQLSLLQAGGRTMFRSPFPQASEDLWQAIRWSRENNPTFIALQNARGAEDETSWAVRQDRNNASRPDNAHGRLRWKLPASLSRSKSYRASSTRALSINSSVETKSSFFSALKLFSGSGNSRFSVARSSIGLRDNPSTFAVNENDDLSEIGGSVPGILTPNIDGRAPGVPLGVSNTKIRFHKLHGQRRWLDLGKARLHILPSPANAAPSTPSPLTLGPGSSQNEKRIVIISKTNETLLDATVPENGFEIYGRVGVAVKVVEDIIGPNGEVGVGNTGGVGSKRLTVYMLQFKSQRDCKYNFLQLGKMRY